MPQNLENLADLPAPKSEQRQKPMLAAPMAKKAAGPKKHKACGRPPLNMIPQLTESDIHRFFSKVDKKEDSTLCWNWNGKVNRWGYGRLKFSHTLVMAHRVAHYLATGIDTPKLILHRCDNPSCCNPSHLFPGTDADNVADCYAKNRDVHLRGDDHPARKRPDRMPRGTKNGSAILTEVKVVQIRELRASGISRGQISKQFNISKTGVTRITQRQTWTHI